MDAAARAKALERIAALPYGLKGFRAFCKLLVLSNGEAFRLERFQAFLLGFYFAGVRELVIILPKKNGKTTLLAALALYHVLKIPSAKCFVGASSQEQATWLYDQAAGLVLRSGLERRRVQDGSKYATFEGTFEVRPGIHTIRYETGFLRILPHDARTSDGVIPTLALVDELHRHPTGGLYTAFRQGLVGDAQMITISTPGVSYDSPLGLIVEKARRYTDHRRERRRSVFTSPNGAFVMVEYGLAEGDDPDHIPTVKMANPASWHTPATLRERRDAPSTIRSDWLRFACGWWGANDETGIGAAEWGRLEVDIGQILEGESVVLVPSVGANAVVGIAANRPDGRVALTGVVLEPQEGTSIRVRTEAAIIELADRYDVRMVAHPLGGFLRSVDVLRDAGLPLEPFPHSPTRRVEATGTFDRLLRGRLIMHDGDANIRSSVLAAEKRTTETGERYEINDRSRAVTALAIAAHMATAWAPEPVVILPSGVG